MGRRFVPSSTIRARMDAKDRRYQREARARALKAARERVQPEPPSGPVVEAVSTKKADGAK